ncbi:putative baseplate assembly protein [Streptomyces longispororuber]|uniref:putative baseplate assembly protein n=1 Tax=Streptomyces longispororuber TaxID=68230 RepID=UPI00210F151D|nr:putative baseplate assembly protein [Streptomyces longispororuber]MCQ4211104.1 putative baseplate assembly protein [Streptomyces longispororuber]
MCVNGDASCSCTAGAATPLPTDNPPGATALHARVGTHAAFLSAMTRALAGSAHPELATLSTRDPADPALALLDAWACVGDILAFYQERIADEGYLGTATERQSLLGLGRLVGYQPRPGLAADGHLAYTLDPDPADAPVTVPTGSQVQSVPDPGEKPVTFETVEDLTARPSWGALRVRTRRPPPMTRECARGLRVVYVDGVGTGVAPNDRLLFHFDDREEPTVRIVESVRTDALAATSALHLVTISPKYEAECADSATRPAEHTFVRLDVLRVRAAPFGAAAPLKPVERTGDGGMSETATAAQEPQEWPLDTPLYKAGDAERQRLWLDGDHPRVLSGSWIVIEAAGDAGKPFPVTFARSQGLAHYGITGKVTVLDLPKPWYENPAPDAAPLLSLHRPVTVHAQAERLSLAAEPFTDVVKGSSVDLDHVITDLPPSRTVLITGTDADSTESTGELARVLSTRTATDPNRPGATPYSVLDLATDLRHHYRRDTVTVWGNAVPATHGETKEEPALGSGDASRPSQRFTLAAHPLTYVAAPDADGEESQLELRVDELSWHETDEVARAAPTEHAYQLRTDDTGTAAITFGDGRRGARLPTGTGNLAARYRIGLGRSGNLRPGQLTQLRTRPVGVNAVTNPLRTGGGTDADTDAALRGRAALPTLAMDRLVGLRDYADFTLARAGVGKALATRLAVGDRELVHVTVAGVDDSALSPDTAVITSLLAAFRRYGDPHVLASVEPRTRWNLVVEARLGIAPDRSPTLLEPHVRAAFERAFTFEARELGQSVYLAEAVAALQGVPGVTFVDVRRFGATPGTTPADAEQVTGVAERVPARPACVEDEAPDQVVHPADLVVAAPGLPHLAVLHLEVTR